VTPVENDLLPVEYQKVLERTQEQHKIDVLLLDQLKGGRTAARLYLASVTKEGDSQLRHLVLKIDQVHESYEQTENIRHKLAISQAPRDFSRDHLAELAFECEWEGFIALLYDIAGGSLHQFRPIANFENQSQLEKIFCRVNELVLDEWNQSPGFEQAVCPQELLKRWLGYRLTSEGYVGAFLEDELQINPDIPGFLIDGLVYPNPFFFGINASVWEDARCIDIICGHQHGDLNLGNILVRFDSSGKNLNGIYLIDFSLYAERMALMYDLCYLEMSYLIGELGRTPIHKCVDLFSRYAGEEMPQTSQVAVELAGSCGVINAGRKFFEDWLNRSHASLVDDLRGQFWLAGVAAGLNFCNKKGLSKKERLAGLIYAAAHLKRYFAGFGIKLPVEVSNLYDRNNPPEFDRVPDQDYAIYHKSVEYPQWQQYPLSARYLPEGEETIVGRKNEIEEVSRMLAENRLVTLNGPGGIGKTRLALAVADGQSANFHDGVYFVPLLSVRSPSGIVPAIAGSLGLAFLEGRMPQAQLLDHLHSHHLLLVLDNLEQLLAFSKSVETIQVVETMLAGAPALKLLVTSRELLRISSERVFTVEGLTVSEDEVREGVTTNDAVELFYRRAKSVNPSFEFSTGENLQIVRRFCQKVEGMPLAIELAAAQLRLMSLEEITNQIDADLGVLDSGLRGARSRHASINIVFGASWQSLSMHEREIYPRLAVFRGGFTLEAALRVAHASLGELSLLIDKSLINRGAGIRFYLHPLIQMFAARKLVETPGELSSTQENHFCYYRDQLHEAVQHWRESSDISFIDQIKPEVDNLRIAWMWVIDQLDWDQTADYSEDLWHLYKILGRLPEAIEMLQEIVEVGQSADPPASPVSLARWERHIGQAHLWLSQLTQGDEYFQQSLSILNCSIPHNQSRLILGLGAQIFIQIAHRAFPGYFIGRRKIKQESVKEAYIAYEHITMRAGVESDTFTCAYCGLRSLNLAEAAGLQSEMARAFAMAGYMIGLIPLRSIAESYLKRAQDLLQQVYSIESDMWISLMSGYYNFGKGELSAAEESFQQTAKLAGEIGKHWEREVAWTQILIIALIKGEWSRCLDYVEQIEKSAQKRGDAGFLAAVIYWDATIKLNRGEMDGVIQLLEESASVPEVVMMVFDWLVVRSSLATANLRLGDFESAILEAEKLETLVAGISRPSGPSYLFGYTGTASAFLELAGNSPDVDRRSEFKNLAKKACKRLRSFSDLFPIALPQAWLYQGGFDWLSGKPQKAFKAWSKSLLYAAEMDIPYQQGLAHYEIGRHLEGGEKAPDGSSAAAHLQRAYQIFTELKAGYDLNLAKTELEKFGLNS